MMILRQAQDERARCICPMKLGNYDPECPVHAPIVARNRAQSRPVHGGYPVWDQPPLTAEAFAEIAPVVVVGKREGVNGWAVCLIGSGPMSPDEARHLAVDLTQIADIVEGKAW